MALICRPLDWFGLNHYSPNYIRTDPENVLGFGFAGPPAEVPRTAIGWPIVPDAFADTLIEIDRRYRVPIYVLENGTAADDKLDASGSVNDPGRIAYIKGYIDAMQRAITAGADVRGYFVWSLLDNFEWGSGLQPALRVGVCRLSDAAPNTESVSPLVCRSDHHASQGGASANRPHRNETMKHWQRSPVACYRISGVTATARGVAASMV